MGRRRWGRWGTGGLRVVCGLAVAAGVLMAACVGAAPQAALKVESTTIEVGGQVLAVEVAADPASREFGLMYRSTLSDDTGMLFVFPIPARHGFWMRNTALPLSVAFLDDDGTIVNIADMAPYSEEIHTALQPVHLALEVKQGWFARHGVKAGQRLTMHLPDGLVVY